MKSHSFSRFLSLGTLLCLALAIHSVAFAAAASGDFITADYGAADDGSQDDVFLVHNTVASVLSGGSVVGADYTQFNVLHNSLVAPNGTIYVIDANPGIASPSWTTVKSINPSTGVATVVTGYNGSTWTGGTGTPFLDYENGEDGCEGLSWDPSTSTLLVCDPGNWSSTSELIRVNPSTGARTIVTGNGVGGTAYVRLTAVVAAPNGDIYVSDCSGGTAKIYKINPSTGAASLITGGVFAGSTASVEEVHGMAWDPSTSTLLITDTGGASSTKTQLIRLNPSTLASSTVTGTTPAGTNVGSGSALTWVTAVFVSGSNKIYITDSAGTASAIYLVDPTTGNRTKINTSGTSGSAAFQGLGIFGTQVHVTGVSSTDSNGAFKAGAVIPITVTFSGVVTVTGSPTLALNTGGTANYASGSGTATLTFNYTVGASANASALDCASTSALSANSGTISGPGDAFAATLTVATGSATSGALANSRTLVIDTIAPTISIGSPSTSSIVSHSGSTVTFLVTYTDANFSASTLSTSNITLNATGGASATLAVTGTGSTRTVTLSSPTGSGTLGISIAAGTGVDTAGNSAPASSASTTFTVTKATGTVTLSGLSPTYTGSPISASSTTSPSGLSVTYTYNGSGTAPSAAGTYTVVGTISDTSYTGTSTSTMTIGKATLNVTGVTATGKTYDGTATASVSASGATLSGVLGADSVGLVSTGITGTFPSKAVGTSLSVGISGLTLSGASSGNYLLVQPTATASISKKTITVSGITAASRTYNAGTSTTLTTTGYSFTGVVVGDTVTLVTTGYSANFATKAVATGETVTVSGLSLGGTDGGNYSLTQPSPTANITAAPLTVTGITAVSRAYDGTQTATLVTTGATLSGVLGSDSVSPSTTVYAASFDTKNVGTGKTVTITGLTLTGTDAPNYTLTQPTATADITQVTLTVTADDKTRSFGQANPTFTASYSGFVDSETTAVLSGAPTLSTTATQYSAAGPYAITASLGSLTAANNNYGFSFANGTLTISADPRASWRYSNFGTSDDSGNAADSADPDGDGLVNLLEYALNSDPNTPSVTALPTVGVVGTTGAHYLTLTVVKNPAATDITYTVESSTDLSTWTSSGLTATTNTTTSLVVQDGTPLGSTPRYLHLRVDPTTVTPAVGGSEVNLPAGAGASAPASTYLSSPFVSAPVWVSAATGVTSQSISYSSGWNGGSFGSGYYVELLDGPLTGLTIDITSQTSDTLNLASAPLGSYGPGMRFAVRAHDTLATIFGASSPSSVAGGTTSATADDVQLYSASAQVLDYYYYKTGGLGGTGWRSTASTSIDQSGTVVDRSQGIGVARKSTGTKTDVLVGDAQGSSQIVPILLGNNLMAITSPVSVTLTSLNLETGDSTTGLVGDTNVTAADEVQRWTGTTWERLYYQTSGAGGTGWRSSTDGTTDRGGQVFNPGNSVLIVKKHGGEALYIRAAFP